MNPSESEFETEEERLNEFFQSREKVTGLASGDSGDRSSAVLDRARRRHSVRTTVSLTIGRLGAGLMGLIQTIFMLLTHGTGPHAERIRRRVERAVQESPTELPNES